jgi:hypothetical protein
MDFDLNSLIGMTAEDADAFLAHRNMHVRVTHQNGQPGFVTADYRTDRINVRVQTIGQDFVITEVDGVG